MSLIRDLWELQEVELEAETLVKKISEIELKLADNEAVKQAKTHLDGKKAELANLQKEELQIGWDLEDTQQKIAAGQKELYSGRVNNPKELLPRQQDIAGLKTKQDQLETKSLELMEQFEKARGELAKAEARLKEAETEKAKLNAELSQELQEHKARLAELKSQGEQLLTDIPAETSQRYYLLRSRKGQAVARIEQGKCCGCRVSLAARQVQEARVAKLIQCSSCGRLLYMP
ncbi:MAG: hypothetical protein V1894_06035 [Chloroflexota bacterium]